MKLYKLSIIALLFAFLVVSCEKPDPIPNPNTTEVDTVPHLLRAEDIYKVKRISDVQLSPDGTKVLYRLATPSIADNKLYSDLYVLVLADSTTYQVTDDEHSDYNARWANDSKSIAFISARDDKDPQIFIYNCTKRHSAQITNVKGGISNMGWSPDNTKFFFTKDVKIDSTVAEKYPQYDKANVRIYKKLPVRHWSQWRDENYSHLFVIDANGENEKDLMVGEAFDVPLAPFGGVEEIAWSPDSKEIAYTCKKMTGLDFVKTTNSEVYVVNVDSNTTKNITEGMPGFDKVPNYSPDGKYIAFTSQRRAGFESDKIRLMLYDRSTKAIRELTTNLDQWVFSYVWAPDSKSLYLTATDSGRISLFNLDLTGTIKHASRGLFNHGNPQVSSDGTTLVYTKQSMLRPTEIFKRDIATNVETQLTNVNKALFANIKDAIVTERWVKAKDGEMIHTWVLLPPEFDSLKNIYPMITYCQGGPQSMIGQRFHYRWNYFLMASHGYVVMLPNRRGLPGFGQAWNDSISGDWAGMPMQDILSCTDAVASEKWIDETNMSAIGASAGGYATFWLAGNHDGRFNAFISHCGVFNMVSMYGSTEELWFPDWENGGPYWGNDATGKPRMDWYMQNSAHVHADKWDTPIMISTGEKDFRVPYTQSLEAFTVAQSKGIPSKLVIYPEETHFIAKPQNFIVWSKEFFEWLDTYCKKPIPTPID